MARAQFTFSLAAAVRWGLVFIFLILFAALALDTFIFYRYSYRVVNLSPEPLTQDIITIDRGGFQKALEILDVRSGKFKELYGIGTTTSLLRKPAD